MWIEPLTGNVLHQEKGPSGTGILSVVPVPRRGKASQQTVMPFIVVDKAHVVHAFPTTSNEASKFVQESADKVFHYEVDGVAQAVQGYVIGKGAGKDSRNQLVKLWNLELGS